MVSPEVTCKDGPSDTVTRLLANCNAPPSCPGTRVWPLTTPFSPLPEPSSATVPVASSKAHAPTGPVPSAPLRDSIGKGRQAASAGNANRQTSRVNRNAQCNAGVGPRQKCVMAPHIISQQVDTIKLASVYASRLAILKFFGKGPNVLQTNGAGCLCASLVDWFLCGLSGRP